MEGLTRSAESILLSEWANSSQETASLAGSTVALAHFTLGSVGDSFKRFESRGEKTSECIRGLGVSIKDMLTRHLDLDVPTVSKGSTAVTSTTPLTATATPAPSQAIAVERGPGTTGTSATTATPSCSQAVLQLPDTTQVFAESFPVADDVEDRMATPTHSTTPVVTDMRRMNAVGVDLLKVSQTTTSYLSTLKTLLKQEQHAAMCAQDLQPGRQVREARRVHK